jgi:ribonucleoside-diphosphate reductase beta chain
MEHYMPSVQTDRSVHDAVVLLQYGDDPYCGLCLLLETIGMPDSEFSAFMEYEEMAAKHDYLGQFGTDTNEDIATSMAVFGALHRRPAAVCSFAMLMNFPRFNKMKGMGQIVTWSVRDESCTAKA